MRKDEDRCTPLVPETEGLPADERPPVKDGVRLILDLPPSYESRDTSEPALLGGRDPGRDPGPLEGGRLPPLLPKSPKVKQETVSFVLKCGKMMETLPLDTLYEIKYFKLNLNNCSCSI